MTNDWASDTETKLTFGGQNFYFEKGDGNIVFFELAVKDFKKAKEVLLNYGCVVTKEYNENSLMIADPYGLHFHLFERV